MDTNLVNAIANAFKLLLLYSDSAVKERGNSARINALAPAKCPQIRSHTSTTAAQNYASPRRRSSLRFGIPQKSTVAVNKSGE